jgi:stage II sporulation protein D
MTDRRAIWQEYGGRSRESPRQVTIFGSDMRHTFPLIALVVILLCGASAVAGMEPTVSIAIFGGRRPSACTITAQAPLKIEAGRTQPAGAALKIAAAGGQVKIDGVGTAATYTVSAPAPLKVSVNGTTHSYRGAIRLSADGGRLLLVNVLGLEDYLRGVVPAEVPPRFAPEAIKAQAIAARTYALSRLARHQDIGCDLCDGVHCQVYLGADAEDPRVDEAIAATAGLIVTYDGKPIDAVYHDSCGGMTASNEEVWSGQPIPYLRSVPDQIEGTTACARGPHATWTSKASQQAVAAALAGHGVAAPLRAIVPQACQDGERAKGYKFVAGDGREWVLCAAEVRTLVNRAVGAATLLSADFTAAVDGDTITFTGRGAGHGVGLCQWGANGLAAAGRTAAEILTHYYTGASVEPMGTRLAQTSGR